MSVVLSVYSKKAFKEYLLPAVDNSNYSLVINRDLFGLNKDQELPMEILDKSWKFKPKDSFLIYYSATMEKYEGKPLKHEDTFSLVLGNGDKISIIVKEIANVFTVFRKYNIINTNEITIGNSDSNYVVYENMGLVSRFHAIIRRKAEECIVEDKSKNGCFINGKRIQGSCELKYGDCLDIFGLRIIYLNSFIAINSFSGNLKICNAALNEYEIKITDHSDEFVDYKEPKKKLFHRSPRYLPKISKDKVEIEAPPAPRENNVQPTFMAIGPALTMALPMMAGSVLSIFGSRMSGGSSGLFMYTGIITAVGSALIGSSWALVNIRIAKKKNREEELRRFQAYSEYLISKSNDIKQKYELNTNNLRELYPNTVKCCEYGNNSLELWNRNFRHEDFLRQRLGMGDLLFPVEIDIPKERFNLVNDSLAEKPKMIKEGYKFLKDVPISVDLFANKMIGVIGGEGKQGCFNVMYNLAAQIAANNCYTDVKMVFVYDENRGLGSTLWEFAKWFPHVWSEDKKTRFVAGNKGDSIEVFYELAKKLRFRAEERENALSDKNVIEKPYYILFLENSELIEGELISKYVYDTTANYGLSTVVLAETYEELPNACEYIVENTEKFRGIYHVADRIDERHIVEFDKIPRIRLEQFARRLASITVKEEETTGEIPNALTFFDMYGVNKPEELGVLDRWKKSRTSETMRALIGQKSGGVDCYLDVHEKYHGPHGLVAGTTGSGKSETLQTYMLSLALNYSPDDIGFFIIDYKGGGMANLFEGLPHMLGQISNLSGNQVKRAMVSIKSENRRRQRIFNEYGVNNINLYTRLYKNNEAKLPIPHMFIIIDEFAELKREEPDFMRELISVAQVGRSLGVHLILATQKPSGTVDDNIWSNSKFRLCLRVQDKQDSMDMLHKPDAAYITQAGRSYLQVGNDELYELFQSGWSGAAYDENTVTIQTNIAKMLSLNGKAAIVGSHAKIVQKEQSKINWIEKLIYLINEAAEKISCKIEDCREDIGQSLKLTKKVFELIGERHIEYANSDYNSHRIQDLIGQYSMLLNEGEITDLSCNSLAVEIIKRAGVNGVKLPEMKEKTQLDAVIAHLADVAKKNNYVNNLKLWLPVLPTELYLNELKGYDTNSFNGEAWQPSPKGYSLDALIGLYDAPENQAQNPVSIDIAIDGNHAIIGTVVTGKSTLLATYLYSLLNRYTPDSINVYIIDYSSKMLGAFENSPHVGGVMFEDDDEKVSKFFTMFNKILEERKRLFKGGSYSQYIQANGLVVPSVLLVIDNMASFREKTEEKYDEMLMKMLKEGLNYGIYIIATAAGFNLSEIPGKMGDNFRTIICLEMNDKFAYSEVLRTMHLEVLPEENVKGRGIAKIGDSILEFQTALPLKAEDEYKRGEAIAERCKLLRDKWKGKVARRIPEIPEKPVWSEFSRLDEVKDMVAEQRYLPIGYDKEDASVYGIDLSKNFCYMVSGKSRTGKTNALKILMNSAALFNQDVVVIDFSGELEAVTGLVKGRYISDKKSLFDYFKEIISTLLERKGIKKEGDAKGLSSEERFELMKDFKKIFIFIWDLSGFISVLKNSGEQENQDEEKRVGDMSGFIQNIFEKGLYHHIFFFAGVNTDDTTNIYESVFQDFVKYGNGIHFGGKVEEQRYLNFEHINYNNRGKSMKPGIGLLPYSEEEKTDAVIIPLYKVEQ